LVRRSAWAILLSAILLITVALIVHWTERIRNADAEKAVYSAYLTSALLNDSHDWSVNTQILLVVENETGVAGNLRWKGMMPFDSRAVFPRLFSSTRASFLFRNLLESPLRRPIEVPNRASVVFAFRHDIELLQHDPAEFEKRFPHNLGYIAMSGVGFNPSRTQAVFYIDPFCGLCDGGRYVLMETVNGEWAVRDEHWTWIS
jgi:hypothetical protein